MQKSTNKQSEIQKEVLDSLEYQAHGILELTPRFGKTKLIIDLIKRDNYQSVLWVSPSVKLIEEDIPNEFKSWKATKQLKSVTFSTYASLSKVEGYYDLVILDEVQNITENNAVNLLNRSIDYISIIGMTGTLSKDREKKILLYQLGLHVIYAYDIDTAVEEGVLNDYIIEVHKVGLSYKKDIEIKPRNKPSFFTSEAKQYEFRAKVLAKEEQEGNVSKFAYIHFMKLIHNSPAKMEYVKKLIKTLSGRTLLFGPSIKQIEEVCEHTYHSKTDHKDLQKFIKGEINLIGMVNSGGTGFTYKDLDTLVMWQVDSDRNGISSQKISRILYNQKDKSKVKIIIICLAGTKDEVWVERALSRFNPEKVITKII